MAPRVVVMGVAGAGKTTVGTALAAALGARFVDADTRHPAANVAKMAAGIPLTDADRAPWLEALAADLAGPAPVVVTCSALKRVHRDVLRTAGAVTFVYLALDPDEARRRVATRPGHFLGPGLVDDQFATLEPPGPDEADVITLDGRAGVDVLVAEALHRLADRR
jgi:gluconokinase